VVSSQPANRSATRWMLQPPPSAKIMNGKERAVESLRSRSDSGNSQPQQKVDLDAEYLALDRRSGGDVQAEKTRKGKQPFSNSRASSRPKRAPRRSSASLSADGQPHDREKERRGGPASFFDTASRDSSQRRRQLLSMRSIASSSEESLANMRRENRRPAKRYSSVRDERARKRDSFSRVEQAARTPSLRARRKEGSQALSDVTSTFNKQTNRVRRDNEIDFMGSSDSEAPGSSGDSTSPRKHRQPKGVYGPTKPSFVPQSPASF
jgi:hypothetical protein